MLDPAGIVAAEARIVTLDSVPVAVIRRFDRAYDGARIPYLSGASVLQAQRHEDRSYTELVDILRSTSAQPTEDVRELWRRLVFNLLITNVDDHLWNVGVLYAGEGISPPGSHATESLGGRGVGRIIHALDVLAGHRSVNRERMKLQKRGCGVAGTCRDFA
jgi:hypothetical protein